jgi:hypothetical protein
VAGRVAHGLWMGQGASPAVPRSADSRQLFAWVKRGAYQAILQRHFSGLACCSHGHPAHVHAMLGAVLRGKHAPEAR